MSNAAAQNAAGSPPSANAGPRRSLLRMFVAGMSIAAIIWAGWRIGSVAFIAFDTGPTVPNRPMSAAPPLFDLKHITVDRKEIVAGGPPKDGIPALTAPRFVPAKGANYLKPEDRVIGLVIGDEAKAYPLAILNFHEIVNDTLANTPIAVTYCPLCDSAAVFDRRSPLGTRDFGVSGLLYNSNVLMYDRGGKPESLWSQLKNEAISGPGAGKSLTTLPVDLTTWRDWTSRHPNSVVLSDQTGHNRDYRVNPYGNYFENDRLMFTANPTSDRLPVKARVLGVWSEDAFRAYPESAFDADHPRVTDELKGRKLTIEYNPEARSLRVVEADKGVEWMYSLWFSWYAMHPETSVFEMSGSEK